MEKVIRDGKVAVLISHGYGAGWSTWNPSNAEIFMFHPKLVKLVEEGRQSEITDAYCEEVLGITGIYTGGANDLVIKWLPVGTVFRIDEYDGSESLVTENVYYTA